MVEIRIEMPESAGMKGFQKVSLPQVPRVGEYIKDVNNRYYQVEAVAYHPFAPENSQQVEIKLKKDEVTTI